MADLIEELTCSRNSKKSLEGFKKEGNAQKSLKDLRMRS
jgi:hypothetical protein